MQGVEAKLTEFIVAELLEEGGWEGGDPLSTDAVDSLGLEQLVEYIEGEFGIQIGSDEVVRGNFGSIPALTAFVSAKLAAAKA